MPMEGCKVVKDKSLLSSHHDNEEVQDEKVVAATPAASRRVVVSSSTIHNPGVKDSINSCWNDKKQEKNMPCTVSSPPCSIGNGSTNSTSAAAADRGVRSDDAGECCFDSFDATSQDKQGAIHQETESRRLSYTFPGDDDDDSSIDSTGTRTTRQDYYSRDNNNHYSSRTVLVDNRNCFKDEAEEEAEATNNPSRRVSYTLPGDNDDDCSSSIHSTTAAADRKQRYSSRRNSSRRSSFSSSKSDNKRNSSKRLSSFVRRLSGTLPPSRRNSLSSMYSQEEEEEEAPPSLATDNDNDVCEFKKMDRTVLCLRLAVLCTIVIATTVVAALTFVYIKRDETDDFTTEYKSAVTKVAQGFQQGVNTKVWAASAFSAMYTSRFGDDDSTTTTQATWPNATMPDFQQQASGLLLSSDGRALSFNPIITNKTRAEWEAHASESATILGSEQLVTRACPTCRIVSDGIYKKENGIAVDCSGYQEGTPYPYTLVPVWQIAPIVSNERAVMFNLRSETNRQRALDDMLTYRVPTLTAIIQLVQDTVERPSSILFYPVMSSFQNNSTTKDVVVVGSISIVFSWDTVLEKILPNYLKGIVCVLVSTNTNQEYTFELDGDSVHFLGQGDLHDDSFDEMELLVDANVEGTSKELGVVDNLITYQLKCYPSQEFKNQYVTHAPVIYMVVVICIFLFTAALFLLYDYLVEHRQSRVSRAAERTGRIVNSMFPAAFRDRLFQQHEIANTTTTTTSSSADKRRPSRVTALDIATAQHEEEEQKQQQQQQKLRSSLTRTKSIKKFLKKASNPKQPDFNVGANYLLENSKFAKDPPIADLFPNTSIMFCDLVGFTTWSATQSPNHVFMLLEALFWEFDVLAQQYGVFKLGTIGDCYIAVTGLPDPMEQHASVLAEYTIECRTKVAEIKQNFKDWGEMEMRFGIHSGPVTAGILRGQKSRFELFGDTINTASRMESTSRPNAIQVSQATANLLRNEGMGSWLAPRPGLVSVKGKGNLSTFWLISPNDNEVEEEMFPQHVPKLQEPPPPATTHIQQQQDEEMTTPRKRSSIIVPMTLTASLDHMDDNDDDDIHSYVSEHFDHV